MTLFRKTEHPKGGVVGDVRVSTSETARASSIRGRCSICDQDVYDTQARQKDPLTKGYQHEACLSPPDQPQSDGGIVRTSLAANSSHAPAVEVEGCGPVAGKSDSPIKSASGTTSQSLLLPVSAKTMAKPLLPGGKHAFLSYQWDVQAHVIQIKELLNQRNVKCTDASFGFYLKLESQFRILLSYLC